MKKILVILLGLTILSGCQDITDKAKSLFKNDMQKVDSLTSVAADSIRQQIERKDQNTTPKPKETKELSPKQMQSLLEGTYSSVLKAIRSGDSLILRQFCYFGDSLVALENRGIFQVIVEEPIEILYGYTTPDDTKGFECSLKFEKFPELTEVGWTQEGCFAQKLNNFHDFSAVIDLSKEAGLEIPKQVEDKVNEFEDKAYYKVLNTYFGIIFYFVLDNNKFYLAAVDLNSTENM